MEMAAMPALDVTEGPVLSVINKRLRGLRKKYNRILQTEEFLAQGKSLHKEQEDVLDSKPYVSAAIDELEKLRQPLAAAVAEEISLAVRRHQVSTIAPDSDTKGVEEETEQNVAEIESKSDQEYSVVEDLLNLLYFGSMFDVKSQNDFTSTMLTRTHERGCCLTYDYVTDDEVTDLLGERDLDLISMLSGLLISRPVDSSQSHKNALQRCIEHAKRWLANSDQPIDSDPNITYAELRAKLNKIMASEYFTKTPEMKATVEMAAAAAGTYASFPVHGSVGPVSMPVQLECSDVQYQQKDEVTLDFQGNEPYDNQSSQMAAEESPKAEFESENPSEVPAEMEPDDTPADGKNHRDIEESREQHYVNRRNYQNQRGGRSGGGGGRRGYYNGRGGRGSGRGGGGGGGAYYQNGRGQYFDQPGNYYQRNYYNRARGSRGGGGNFYINHNLGAQNNRVGAADS